MTPYYEQDGITIYHGDCRDVLHRDPAERGQFAYDLLLTDPPYGIKMAKSGRIGTSARTGFSGKTGKAIEVKDYGVSTWDSETSDEAVALARSLCCWQVIFGGNFYDLPPSSCWLVWDKDNTGDFADCELAWTNLKKAVRKLTHRWNGMLQQPGCPREFREHPTQKPEAVMRWALMQAPADVQSVLDPFMGSGTTLVAAKRLGRRATGIEREERWCEIAARRLQQGALGLFHEATA